MSLRGVALLAALAAALPCCRSSQPSYQPTPGPYETVDAQRLDALAEARVLADAGEIAAALSLVEGLAASDASDLQMGRLRQDLILELEGAAGEERLRRECETAVTSGTLPALLLAARLEPDESKASAWIAMARAADGRSAWPAYAAAHWAARTGDWGRARLQVQAALAIDAAHLPARRLEAAIAARGNDRQLAIGLLRAWIAASDSSPYVSARERLEAHLDLAHLLVLSGEAGEALALLEDLPDPLHVSGRTASLLASVQQDLGRPVRALQAARAAQRHEPDASLPLVQEALLQESHLSNPQAAREAWKRVLERAHTQGDLSGILLGMRARIALERSPAVESSAVQSEGGPPLQP